VIAFDEVRKQGWIVVGDDVYNISDWAEKHPGGREILQLRGGDATISELAAPFAVSFAAVSKHVQVLERAGLVTREVVGREHRLSLVAAPLREASEWTQDYRGFWEARLDALDAVLRASNANPRRPARRPRSK
jgi:DNA-binding transcriptional ArsR family regulator